MTGEHFNDVKSQVLIHSGVSFSQFNHALQISTDLSKPRQQQDWPKGKSTLLHCNPTLLETAGVEGILPLVLWPEKQEQITVCCHRSAGPR